MVTYQDLLDVRQDEQSRMDFVQMAIGQHKASEDHRTAKIADDYLRHKNTTITNYQKLLYTISGKAVPDNFSSNYKMGANFFARFVVQGAQYLLGNGISWAQDGTKEKLGADFDTRVQECAKNALSHGCAYGFWNLDHLEVFDALTFVPLWDETNGALMAGVRYWQIDSSKPMRATLYEPDGFTEYIWEDGEGSVLQKKRPYVLHVIKNAADGVRIYDGENYPSFPIVPLWGSTLHQSAIIGLRQQIDCYDLIKSGFANDLDDASQIYWTIQNGGGMDDVDLARFVERMHTVKAAVVDQDGGSRAEAHTIEVPYASREALLDRIERDLYRDAMALDVYSIAGGATTATQILAAYEPLNNKTDEFEYCVIQFLQGILHVAGIDDKPTFTRSMIINRSEEIQNVLQAAQVLEPEYVVRKVLEILGDADQAEEMLGRMAADALGNNRAEEPAQEETVAQDAI